MSSLHRAHIKDLLRASVTLPTKRDEQSSVGPSEIANPCDYCLGFALTRKYPELRPEFGEPPSGFSLKAWTGTAVHALLEKNIVPAVKDRRTSSRVLEDVLVEVEAPVWELSGYGLIKGHVDLVYMTYQPGAPQAGPEYVAVIDHKTVDKNTLQGFRVHGIPDKHVFQVNLYGYGLKRVGYPVQDVGLHYIPRDSNSVDDIWACFDSYREDVAEMALLRLEEVWEKVRAGDLLKLEQHPECFPCSRRF